MAIVEILVALKNQTTTIRGGNPSVDLILNIIHSLQIHIKHGLQIHTIHSLQIRIIHGLQIHIIHSLQIHINMVYKYT